MLNPLMLLGLLGLAGPIIIHLIQRQRLKPQPLATLRFLDREDLANAFAPVPRDVLQLLLRLALLALFVLLMSRPWRGSSEPGPRTLAVIWDQSLSMQQVVQPNVTLFERARKQIADLVAGLRPQDRLALVVVGDTVSLDTGYLQDPQKLAAAVTDVKPADGGSLALPGAIRAAVEQLASRSAVNPAVLVFSDHQKSNYTAELPKDESQDEANKDTLAQLIDRSGVRVLLVDEQPPTAANLSIESARFTPQQVYLGTSSRLTATVRNHTSEEQTTNVALFEGEVAGAQRPLTLAPGEAAQIDLVHRFEAPADSACRVELDEDILPGDSRFYLPMRIKERRQVLLVTPQESTSTDEGLELSYRGVDLLAYALNPGELLGLGGGTNVNVKRITPQVLTRTSLPIYSLIVLDGISDLEEQSLKDLEAFVRAGGGIWLIPQIDTSPRRFSDTFSRLLGGFVMGQLKQPAAAVALSRAESTLTDPLLLPLVRDEWGSAADVQFTQFFGVETPGSAKIALRSAEGDSLAVAHRLERGQVYVQLFGNDLDSSSLARTTVFVPYVQHVSSHLGRQGEVSPPDVMHVGEVLRMRLPEFRKLQGNLLVSGPEKQRLPLVGQELDEARIENLDHAGVYTVAHSAREGGRTRLLAVNAVDGESELAPLSDGEITTVFGESALRLPIADVDAQFVHRTELLPTVLVLVFIGFAIEALLGAWQSRARGPRRAWHELAP